MSTDYSVFVSLQNTIQSSKNCERKNNVSVFVGFEESTKDIITDIPDEG
jgi:hypothetical protein